MSWCPAHWYDAGGVQLGRYDPARLLLGPILRAGSLARIEMGQRPLPPGFQEEGKVPRASFTFACSVRAPATAASGAAMSRNVRRGPSLGPAGSSWPLGPGGCLTRLSGMAVVKLAQDSTPGVVDTACSACWVLAAVVCREGRRFRAIQAE